MSKSSAVLALLWPVVLPYPVPRLRLGLLEVCMATGPGVAMERKLTGGLGALGRGMSEGERALLAWATSSRAWGGPQPPQPDQSTPSCPGFCGVTA